MEKKFVNGYNHTPLSYYKEHHGNHWDVPYIWDCGHPKKAMAHLSHQIAEMEDFVKEYPLIAGRDGSHMYLAKLHGIKLQMENGTFVS